MPVDELTMMIIAQVNKLVNDVNCSVSNRCVSWCVGRARLRIGSLLLAARRGILASELCCELHLERSAGN